MTTNSSIPTAIPVGDRFATRLAIAAAAFLFCYAELLMQLVRQWSDNAVYSYGFAVPLISGYIVWSRWPQLKSVPRGSDGPSGSLLVVLGAVTLAVGRLGGLTSLEGISFLITLVGIVLLLAGGQLLRRLWFPIAYLVMMLPIWGIFISWLQLPGQKAAAVMATSLLRAVGIPAFHQGTTIVLPTVSLEVMPECSGINQLIALTVMALPAGYLWLAGRARRLIFIATAVVLGYLSNGLRVAILGWLTSRQLPVSDPHSALHLLPGFVSIGLAYLLLGMLLTRLGGPASHDFDRGESTSAAAAGDVESRVGRRHWAEIMAVAVMTAAGAFQFIGVPREDAGMTSLIGVPTQLPDWTMVDGVNPASVRFPGFDETLLGMYHSVSGERRFVGVDDEVLRKYRSGSGAEVEMYIGYYRHQADGKELSGDVAHALQRVAATSYLTHGSDAIAVNEVVQHRGETDRGIVFWYDINGRIVPNIYKAKLYSVWDALRQGRTSGAVVMVAWTGAAGPAARQARIDALAFCQALLSFPNDIVP